MFIQAQNHQFFSGRNLEFATLGGQINTYPQYFSFNQERLSKEDTLVILKDLERLGCVEFVIGSEKILVSHFSPYEMADDMYRWAKQNYLLGDVETLQFITEGELTTPKESTIFPNTEFYHQPKQIILKVIDILQKQNKAVRI